jgi:hypothetical protein
LLVQLAVLAVMAELLSLINLKVEVGRVDIQVLVALAVLAAMQAVLEMVGEEEVERLRKALFTAAAAAAGLAFMELAPLALVELVVRHLWADQADQAGPMELVVLETKLGLPLVEIMAAEQVETTLEIASSTIWV